MSALNSLPLPVVRLLAFFHEELSERRPGRVPQTVQLWVGCLLVILISMTFEIPFVALSDPPRDKKAAIREINDPVRLFIYGKGITDYQS